MVLKKLCAALMSVTMSVNMLMGQLPFNPANHFDPGSLSGTIQLLTLNSDSRPETAAGGNFRRPVSPQQPMYIVHIDSWNYADPAKIIDLVPKDILPYVVFNISLSINWNGTRWLMVQNGEETARSWLRTCAEKGVWAMIQPASGGQCHFPDYAADDDLENTIFGEFFRDYPNFIGYNYCEQFWGFDQEGFTPSCADRYRHFAALLKLCNKYGGYLDVSWCANRWSPGINPIAMLKTVPEWEKACRLYSQNYILEEKYTQLSYIADVESLVYGAYISGYCGNFGIRYDDSGWSDSTWDGKTHDDDGKELPIPKEEYRLATGLPIHLERMALNGATVIDGPELVWTADFKELNPTTDGEGYSSRKWAMYDQFQNDMLDMFRKVLDGTVRIPSRAEVIERTKVAIIQDGDATNNALSGDAKFSTYPSLFEGLYRIDSDGNLYDNHNPFKQTGRYSTIPTVYKLADDPANSIQLPINQSAIPSRWPTVKEKQDEFNALFPEESWGNLYAGRNENTWITYNPNKNGSPAGGYFIPKYNTCRQVELSYSEYASAVVSEYADHIDFYMNNYDEKDPVTLKTNTIKIYGASSKPQFTIKHRGVNQTRSSVSENWNNGVYILTVNHNGPLDISVSCSGNETGRLTEYQEAGLVAPAFPDEYTGTRQYEAEFFDCRSIERLVKNGCSIGATGENPDEISGFYGQGFVKFGTKDGAAVRDTVPNKTAGEATMTLRYSAAENVNLDLYVNDTKAATFSLTKGTSLSDWQTVTQKITLKEGDNKIELKAPAGGLKSNIFLDFFTIG